MPRSLSDTVDKIGKKPDEKFLKFVNVENFLERLDIANVHQAKSDEFMFSCPFPGHSHGDEHPSCSMNDGSINPHKATKFVCFGCGRRGNAISFLAEHEGISYTKARRQIKETYARNYYRPDGGIATELKKHFDSPGSKGNQVPEALDWKLYKQFEVDWEYYADNYRDKSDVAYMLDRGFTADNLNSWQIGYDAISSRITIPIFDHKRNFVGIKGRAWKRSAKNKYIAIGDKRGEEQQYGFRPYEKSLVVFGLHRYSRDQWPTKWVYNEGEINIMSLQIMGFPAFSTGNAMMSEAQQRIIIDNCDELVLWFDLDNAGKNGVWGFDKIDGTHVPGIIERLEPFMKIKVVYSDGKLDANDYHRKGRKKELQTLIESAIPSYLAQRPE